MRVEGSVAIYGLYDPRDDSLRYVGYSIDPQGRYYSHIGRARSGVKSHCYSWIRQLMALDMLPAMRVIEWVADGAEKAAEIAWIARLRGEGHPLTNSTVGGDGTRGHQLTPEQVERRRAQLRAMERLPFSDEHRAKLREAGKRRTMSAWQRWQLAIANAERALPPSELARRREAELARPKRKSPSAEPRPKPMYQRGSPEHRAHISAKMRGREISPEHRAKIADSLRGRKRPADVVERARDGHLARYAAMTPEQRRWSPARRAAEDRRQAASSESGDSVSPAANP